MSFRRLSWVALAIAPIACGRAGLEDDTFGLGGTSGSGASGGAGGGGSGGLGGGGLGGGGLGGTGAAGAGGIGGGPVGGFGGTGGSPSGDCCSPHDFPGCEFPGVAQCVCAADAFCCQQAWDDLCVEEVSTLGCGSCGTGGSGGVGGFGGGPVGGFGGGGFGGGPIGGFGGTGGTPGFCGNGVTEPGEQCDLGPGNQDRPAFLLQQGAVNVPVTPLDTGSNAVNFYGYSSASSHTGFEELMASRIILHRNVNGGQLSLIMHHGIDFNSSGLSQPSTQVKAVLSGLPSQTFVTVADDTLSEFNKDSSTSAFGAWQFAQNSDGGALSQLPIPGNWIINITLGFSPGINDLAFVHGNASFVNLNLNQSITLIANDSPAKCRMNCTIPVCGDGILDGGEVCEPALTKNCAPGCKSLL